MIILVTAHVDDHAQLGLVQRQAKLLEGCSRLCKGSAWQGVHHDNIQDDQITFSIDVG